MNANFNFANAKRSALYHSIVLATITVANSSVATVLPSCDNVTSTVSACSTSGSVNATIASSGKVVATYPDSAAVNVGGTFTGAITNDGSVGISANTYTSVSVKAIGVNNQLGSMTGALDNNGTIDVDVSRGGPTYQATGFGVYISDVAGGQISNSGSIDVSVTNTTKVSAIGVLSKSIYSNGSFENTSSGIINVVGSEGSSNNATGLNIGSISDASVANSGTISAMATSGKRGNATGVKAISLGKGGSISNEGAINANATGLVSRAIANGISVSSNSSVMSNGLSGTIKVAAESSYTASGNGMLVDQNSNSAATIINKGMISVDVDGVGAVAAKGIAVSNLSADGASIVNKGKITVSGDSKGGSVNSTGIYAASVYNNSSVTNSGEITVVANGTAAAAAGIRLGNLGSDGSVVNSGTITVSASGLKANANSLYIRTKVLDAKSSGSVLNAQGGLLDGNIYIEGAITLTNNGTIIGGGDVSGAYNLGETGVHRFKTTSLSDYDQLTVGGVATIANGASVGIDVDTDTAAYALSGTTYDDVISAGTLVVTGDIAGDTGSIIWQATAVDDGNNAIDLTLGLVTEVTIAPGDVVNEGEQFALRIPDTGGAAPVIINNGGTIDGAVDLGDSVLNLQGNSSLVNGAVTGFAGSTVNVAGEFTSGGAFNVGAFNINSGGSFTPLHTLTAVVKNDGTFNIAAGQKATILGSYIQGADGVLSIGVKSVDSYGQLDVTGAVDLAANNALTLKVSVDETLAADQTLNDVISAGTLTADAVTIEDDSTFWNFEATVDGNTLDIVTVVGETVVDIVSGESGPAYTPLVYALGIAAALDELISLGTNNADINDLIMALDNLETPEQIANAVGQLVPVLVGQGSQVAQQIVGQIGSVVSQRMSSGRVKGGVSSGDPMMVDAHVWAKVLGTKAERGEIDGTPGYDADSYSFTLGFDGDISEDTLVGLAFTYSEADVDGNMTTNNQLDIEGYQLTGYASYTLDESAFVDVLVTVGSNSNKTSRQVNIGAINLAAKADYDSWFTRVYSAIGRDYQANEQLTITPMLSLSYTYIDEDSYTEKGLGDVGFDVKGRDEESAVAGLDILGVYDVDDQNRITAHVGMGYEMLSDSTIISSSFIGGGSVFKTEGPDRDPENYRFGIGYELNTADSLELRVNYDYEAAEEYDNQILSATARWLW